MLCHSVGILWGLLLLFWILCLISFLCQGQQQANCLQNCVVDICTLVAAHTVFNIFVISAWQDRQNFFLSLDCALPEVPLPRCSSNRISLEQVMNLGTWCNEKILLFFLLDVISR